MNKIISMEQRTTYIQYLGAKVTLEKNLVSFVDFNNTDEIRSKVDEVFADKSRYELKSDGTRYRVYLHKQELGQLFTGIEEIYRATQK